MKTLLCVLIAISACVLSYQRTEAGGDHRASIDQKWRNVERWRKAQDVKYNEIWSEASRALKSQDRQVPDRSKLSPNEAFSGNDHSSSSFPMKW
jgi:hypothetical protein